MACRTANSSTINEWSEWSMISLLSGLALFILGMFLISQNTIVSTGYFFGGVFGGFNPPFGLLLLPVIIGVILLFTMKRKIWGWILIATGLVTILAGVLMSLRIVFRPTTLYITILMFACLAAGIGLIIRGLIQVYKK